MNDEQITLEEETYKANYFKHNEPIFAISEWQQFNDQEYWSYILWELDHYLETGESINTSISKALNDGELQIIIE